VGHGTATVGARGFTLLEVVLTLFVLALLAGVSVPMIGRSTEAIRARAEVAGFSAVLRHAREQAIATQRPHEVVVDPIEHRVAIVADEKTIKERSFAGRFTVETTASTVRFEPHGVSSGGEFRVTSGAVSYRVTIDSLTGRVKARRE
jgi:prepilin-type N-terminal cleavage/methylation domain-containing protein